MGASDEVGTLRWTRCVVELVRAACHMCPTSMGVAYLEMLHKLSRWVADGLLGNGCNEAMLLCALPSQPQEGDIQLAPGACGSAALCDRTSTYSYSEDLQKRLQAMLLAVAGVLCAGTWHATPLGA